MLSKYGIDGESAEMNQTIEDGKRNELIHIMIQNNSAIQTFKNYPLQLFQCIQFNSRNLQVDIDERSPPLPCSYTVYHRVLVEKFR